ncbi:MAG TPA: L,D-transpeptidase [Solirubrobacteraceae bacterium]|jgi:hypothetical protein
MSRHLATTAAALAAAIASLALGAGGALAAGPSSSSATAASTVAAPTGPPASLATTGSPATTTAASKPSTKPAKGKTNPKPPVAQAVRSTATLFLKDAFFVRHGAVTVPDRLMHVSGVVRPYVPGQWVNVKAYLGRKLIKSYRLRIKPSAHGSFGAFSAKVKSTGTGVLHIRAMHARTAQMLGFLAQRGVASVAEHAGFGARGTFVDLVQQRLAALHIYIPQTGVYDQQTGLAIDAYHRLLGRGTSQNLDPATTSALLDGVGHFKVHDPSGGTHAEGNLSKQLLALVNGSKVYAIYPISSGKPSTPTILGHFHVDQRTPGYLPDGMYYSDFFYGGYAIHGYDPAPDYPASHGCMRLPIVDAISVFNWLNYGDVVDVYY